MRIALSLLVVLPLFAHHSVQAEHDTTKLITVKGTVTLVEWMNPHSHFYLDVVEPDGKVTNQAFEFGSPNVLRSLGVTRDSLKKGDQISVDAYASKNGGKFAAARTLTWPDGRTLDVHDSFGGQK